MTKREQEGGAPGERDERESVESSRADAQRLAQFLDSIIEHMPAMVFVKDARELRFERFNRAGEDLLGLSREEMLGKTDHDFFPREQADFFVSKDRAVLEGKTLVDIPEEPIETPHGTRYLHTRKIPLLDARGEPQHLLGISLDVTEHKRAQELQRSSRAELEKMVLERTAELQRQIDERQRAEAALAQTEEQLRQAQKMEAIGRLAGGVAHDFNNLLSVVISYCDLILLKIGGDDSLRMEVDEIRRAGLRAADLTRQLLAFSRQQVLQPRTLQLNDVLVGMHRMLSRVLGEDIALELETDPALHNVKADPSQIEQVILNLVVNARDAMPAGGLLRIETLNLEPKNGSRATDRASVALIVSDSGQGMDAETRARVFEPFFTTKAQGKGTGLGLSTVFGIVRQSGGSIQVESEPGKGARFCVQLPSTDDEHPSYPPPSVEDAHALAGEETILLVEDDSQVRALAAIVLRRFGYTVLEAGVPSEAMALATNYAFPIDLLLTDVVMPEKGGRALAQDVVRLHPRLRVLFLSGYANDATVHHGVSEGLPFLSKPFTPEGLARHVRAVLQAPLVDIGAALLRGGGNSSRPVAGG